MKHFLPLISFAAFVLLSCGCSNDNISGGDSPAVPEETFEVSYTESMEDFPNPERGFYKYTEVSFSGGRIPSPISAATLEGYRKSGKTLVFQYNYITDFIDGPISDEALSVIRQNMQVLREAGMKVVLRFAYKDGYAESDKPWDAPVDVVLSQVEQLKPIFQEYYDVIYVLQAGFVGSWGEWYYTDHFNYQPKTAEDYGPRRQLLKALLDALPEDRQVAVRYPQAKRMCMEMELADSISAATAFDGSYISRIAGHNDCFVSSSNDVGTYVASGDMDLWATETNYVSMGGETCAAYEYYCNCSSTLEELEKYHWSYLNSDYNVATHAVWKDEDCYDEISRRLGYRIVLEGANFGDSFAAGDPFDIDIKLKNVGFASMINPRDLEFVICSETDPEEKYVIGTDVDPRIWKAGKSYRLKQTITLPTELRKGTEYRLCLNLPDPAATLHDNPLFSIRLANEGVWDETTGYNVLHSFVAE